jgi:hypothetical protein
MLSCQHALSFQELEHSVDPAFAVTRVVNEARRKLGGEETRLFVTTHDGGVFFQFEKENMTAAELDALARAFKGTPLIFRTIA